MKKATKKSAAKKTATKAPAKPAGKPAMRTNDYRAYTSVEGLRKGVNKTKGKA
jgi:hypothetical protein